MSLTEYLLFFFDNYLDLFAVVLPVLILLLFGKRITFPGKLPIILFYLTYFVIGCLLSYFSVIDNLYFHLCPLIYSLPLYFAFYSILSSKVVVKISFAMLLTIYVINRSYVSDYYFNAQFNLYLNYFILINASAFLFQEFSSMKNEFFIEKIEFWFCISILFYAVVSSFFFTFVQYTIGYGTAEYELLTHMYGICQSTPLLISGLIFSIAIFKNKNSIRW